MTKKHRNTTSISRFLSLVLRHKPETIDIRLDENGWVSIETLLTAMNKHGKSLDRQTLETVVRENDKQRFFIDFETDRIRASQGHSVKVDLQLEALRPPNVLYHGTPNHFVASILTEGLKPKARHHVHLSADRNTAVKVGERRGSAVILEIDAAAMAEAGHQFYRSANGVWLVDRVPATYLKCES